MKQLFWSLVIGLVLAAPAAAQDPCTCYQIVPQIQYRAEPVTQYRLVEETVYERQQQTVYKPVWKTERRERRSVVRKPIYATSERVEEETVMKKIIETVYEEKRFEETWLEPVTEMQDREVVIETPVTETAYREQQRTVRKPITETTNYIEDVAVLRPQTITEQAYATTMIPSTQWVQQPGGFGRSRLQYVPSGYYPDPVTGAVSYYRGGFRWVPMQRPDSWQPVTTTTSAMVPYTVQRTAMVPETVRVERPVETTRYVEEVVTERVPITTQSTRREVVTQKVPVVVQRETKRIVTEKVPVEKVRYVPYIVTKKTPITTVTYQDVETVEPYDVQVLTHVAETSEVQVPRRVRRWVPYAATRLVPETQFVPRVLTERRPLESSPVASDTAAGGEATRSAARLPTDPAEPEIFYGTPVITERPAESVIDGAATGVQPKTDLQMVDAPQTPETNDDRSGEDQIDAARQPAAAEGGEPAAEADKVPDLNQGN